MGTRDPSLSRAGATTHATTAVSAADEPIAILHQCARALANSARLDDMLRQALLAAAQLTNSSHATILLLDTRGDQVRYRATLGDNVAPLEMVAGPMMSRGLAGWVTRERQTVLVRDTESDPRWLPGPGLGDLRSAIVAPLAQGTCTLGILTLGSETADHYDERHARLAEIVGAQLTTALLRSGAPQSLERAATRDIVALSAEMRGLIPASARLAAGTFFDHVLRAFYDEMAGAICGQHGRVEAVAGAALLAIFEAPAIKDAVRAALAMQAAAAQLRARWHERQLVDVASLHVGISAGPAMFGCAGLVATSIVGPVVGEAVQLRELAGSGETLVAGAVARALEGEGLRIVPLPPLRLESPALQQIFQVGPPNGARQTAAVGLKQVG